MAANPRLWFYDQDINIFPIDRRDKSPIVPKGTSQFDYRCTRLEAERMGDYGVPGGLLAFADSDSPEAEAWAATSLPDTPFKVTTARGLHRYYRIVGTPPKFFHRAGLTIEFRNHGQYVVGPGSVHASGVIYTASTWSWNILDLPIFPTDFLFDDRPLTERGSTEGGAPLVLPPVIKAGERHDLMFKLMRSLQARGVTDLAVLLKVLYVENQAKCSPPIERRELEKYISRVAKYRDRPGFERDEQEAGSLAGGMLDTGLSLDAALTLVKALDPTFQNDPPPDYTEVSQPKQPKQPFSESKIATPLAKQPAEASPKMATSHLSKPSLSCRMCGHNWTQQRQNTPKKCPQCKSIRWNSPQIFVADDDSSDEIIDLSEGDDDLEIVDLDEDDGSEIYEEEEEDGPIYDEDTGEIVGEVINGVTTWKESK